MDTLLKTVGSPDQPLGWSLHKGVLLITMRSVLEPMKAAWVYNVKALIIHHTGTKKSRVDPRKAQNLARLIEASIDRNSWIDNGGPVGSLKIYHCSMVVATTRVDQEAIANLLRKLKNGEKAVH